jgi:hypothetical protein
LFSRNVDSACGKRGAAKRALRTVGKSPLNLSMNLEAAFNLGDIDIAPHARSMAECGRVHIPNFLETRSAKRLLTSLEMETRWNLVTTLGGVHRDLDHAGMDRQDPVEKARFFAHVYAPARAGDFQYLFGNIPIYDAYHRGTGRPYLNTLFEFLNGEPMLDVARKITGCADIGFADAQATRYSPGHFLTVHDDGIEGKDRRAAYVLNLTPDWRADWGGLTAFLGADGHVDEAFTPKFNALNLFRVPQPHAVTVVAPFAPRPRFAITGWFSAGRDLGIVN